MKKRLFVLVSVLCILSQLVSSAYSEEITGTETDILEFDPQEYVPEEIKQQLESAGMPREEIDINQFVLLIKSAINDNSKKYIAFSLTCIVITIIYSVVYQLPVVKKSSTTKTIAILSLTYIIINNLSLLSDLILVTLQNISSLLKVTSPALASVLLLGNTPYSSLAATSSLSLTLIVIEQIFITALYPVSLLLIAFTLTDHTFSSHTPIGMTKSLKKAFTTITVFVFSLLVSLIALSGSVAAGKDSISMRTIKFATANIIPIIGASASEAMKTVTIGATYIKNHMGALSACAIASVALPCFIEIFLFKVAAKISAVFASLIGCGDLSAVMDSASDATDIFLSIVSAVSIISYIFLFVFSSNILVL